MTSPSATIDRLDWADIAMQLDIEGYAVLPGLLDTDTVRSLARQIDSSAIVRVLLSSIDLGRGEWFYFRASLPTPLETWRTAFYRHLVAVADRWNETLGVDTHYPPELGDFLRSSQKAGQTQAHSRASATVTNRALSSSSPGPPGWTIIAAEATRYREGITTTGSILSRFMSSTMIPAPRISRLCSDSAAFQSHS